MISTASASYNEAKHAREQPSTADGSPPTLFCSRPGHSVQYAGVELISGDLRGRLCSGAPEITEKARYIDRDHYTSKRWACFEHYDRACRNATFARPFHRSFSSIHRPTRSRPD